MKYFNEIERVQMPDGLVATLVEVGGVPAYQMKIYQLCLAGQFSQSINAEAISCDGGFPRSIAYRASFWYQELDVTMQHCRITIERLSEPFATLEECKTHHCSRLMLGFEEQDAFLEGRPFPQPCLVLETTGTRLGNGQWKCQGNRLLHVPRCGEPVAMAEW